MARMDKSQPYLASDKEGAVTQTLFGRMTDPPLYLRNLLQPFQLLKLHSLTNALHSHGDGERDQQENVRSVYSRPCRLQRPRTAIRTGERMKQQRKRWDTRPLNASLGSEGRTLASQSPP